MAAVSFLRGLLAESRFGGAPAAVLSDRYRNAVLPWCASVAERLDLPEWPVYREAWRSCLAETREALAAAWAVWCLTARPVLPLAGIVLRHLWAVFSEHGGNSLRAAAVGLSNGCVRFWRFQRALTPRQLLAEAGLVAVLTALYQFRKWLRRQTYWAELVRWHGSQKRRLLRVRRVCV